MEKSYKVVIKGVSPLLHNRFSGSDESGTPTKKKSQTTKENNVRDTLYQQEGKPYQPSESIRQALIEAGKAFKKGKSNLSRSFASFVVFEKETLDLPYDWGVDRRAVVIPSTKGRVMRNRARFDEWSLTFIVKVLDDDEINQKTLHDAIEYAGHYIGIGDYRPQKKGMYGRFILTSFSEVT